MIKQKVIYVAKCDGKGCKKTMESYPSSDHAYFLYKSNLISQLKFSRWQRKGKKWFCPDCQEKK